MQGQVIDTDLVAGNIVDGVEIFGVTGSYTNTILDYGLYYLGGPAISQISGGTGGNNFRGALRFFDDGTKIIIMGSSEVESYTSSPKHGLAGYYAEIVKSTGVLTAAIPLYLDAGTTTSRGNTKMVYTSIGGSNRYGFTRASSTSSSAFFYYNGTAVVQGGGTEILAASNIGSSSISYRGRTLQQATLITVDDLVTEGKGGACLQLLQYT